jgi:hypothetical protein
VDVQVCPDPVVCLGPSLDYAERRHQLGSWQTDRPCLVAYCPAARGRGVLSNGRVWGSGFLLLRMGFHSE